MACPVCGTDGDAYRGPSRSAQRHFFARALWSLHRVRQELDAEQRGELASRVSEVIKILEAVGEAMLGESLH